MVYVVYFDCPHCKHPERHGCIPSENANECIDANSKAEARSIFTQLKPCRHMKIRKIEEYKP